MSGPLNRRNFIGGAAAAGAASYLGGPGAENSPAAEPAANAVAKSARKKASVDWPRWNEQDEDGLLDVLNSGVWGRTGGGRKVPEFEARFAQTMKARYCVATASGTTALLTTLGALGLGPGDEVILPPYTFVASFNVITSNYALPIFVDVDADTFQLDPKKIDAAITTNTKVILPVHVGGSPADMTAINDVAKARKVTVIEDACQAPLAEVNHQPVGTIGLGGCFSFQASKNLNSGEGGAVLTNDESFYNLCFNFHTPGGGKSAPSSGRASNFRLTEFQASILLSQYDRFEEQSKSRDANASYLSEMLNKIPGISPAKLATGCTRSGWHLYMLRYDRRHFADIPREKLLKELAKAGVSASSGYSRLNKTSHVQALASNPHYIRIYGKETMSRWLTAHECPVNDRLCDEALWLGQTKLLGTKTDMERIAEAFGSIQKRAGDIARTG